MLLSGEYLVLLGAEALAVPLKIGQRMTVFPGDPGMIRWNTRVLDEDWFFAEFHIPDLEIAETSDDAVAAVLKEILRAGESLKPGFFSREYGWQIKSHLEFHIQWGLGSSSSLVSNIAWWMDVDPYLLFKKVYPGSGYDIFCARAGKPILFHLSGDKPAVSEIDFRPPFPDNLFFIYLGRKQDSQLSVSKFREEVIISKRDIDAVSGLTRSMVAAGSLQEFVAIMEKHEEIISSLLNQQPVGKSRFSDFPGAVKSLGAWGGDFILAASSEPEKVVADYFNNKGLSVIFKYHDLVL